MSGPGRAGVGIDRPFATSATAAPGWARAKRVLVVRLDNLGDVLMATPAIAALRAGLPKAHIALLASPSGAALVPFLDDVDQAVVFEAPWVKHTDVSHPADGGAAERAMVARLASMRFDAAVILTTCTQSALAPALLCRMAGIPLRLAHSRENPYALLTDWVPEGDAVADGMRHEVERQLALLESVGFRTADRRLRFDVRQADRDSVAERLRRAGADEAAGYVVVHPGATAASRRYPAERFGAAAEHVARATGHAIVLAGGAGDHALLRRVADALSQPPLLVAGELALGELAALIEGAELLIANNSGPAHIAAAVGTALVDLYALTNPQHTPWLVPARVLNHPVPCRNCLKSTCPQGHHDCLRRVEPAAVAAAAVELLGMAGPRRQPHRPLSLDALAEATR